MRSRRSLKLSHTQTSVPQGTLNSQHGNTTLGCIMDNVVVTTMGDVTNRVQP